MAKKTEEKKDTKATAKLGGPVTGKNATVANVLIDDVVIRTYTSEKHGKNFVDLANEFASKDEGRKVVTE